MVNNNSTGMFYTAYLLFSKLKMQVYKKRNKKHKWGDKKVK